MKVCIVLYLELTAAVLAAYLDLQLQFELCMKFSDVILLTDSLIVVRYIRKESNQFKTFIANHFLTKDTSSRY